MSIRTTLLASSLVWASLQASPSEVSSAQETRDRIWASIHSLLMIQGDKSGLQSSFETKIPFWDSILNLYGAFWEDPRFGAHHASDSHDAHNDMDNSHADTQHEKTTAKKPVQNQTDNMFILWGISLQHKWLDVGVRGLMLDNEQFWEIYGQYTGRFPEMMHGADAWLRIGITQPSGINLSAGTHIHATAKTDIHASVIHEQSEDTDRPSWTLIHTKLSHDISDSITCFTGLEYHHGEDYGSFPYANIIDTHSPGFVPFAVPGEWLNALLWLQFHITPDTEVHMEALYNVPEKYCEIMTQITSKIHDNVSLSGGVLFDTRPGHDPMGYLGVKLKF